MGEPSLPVYLTRSELAKLEAMCGEYLYGGGATPLNERIVHGGDKIQSAMEKFSEASARIEKTEE